MLRLFKRALARNTRAGVAFDGPRTGLARVWRMDDGRLSVAARILHSGSGDNASWTESVLAPISALKLGTAPVSVVLAESAYQLQLIEPPNVPADEMLAAVRWRIKDLIDFPIDEAVVEIFEMPRHARSGQTASAYAVVTRSDEVRRHIGRMHDVDLQLEVIDIPELCMRNIAALLPQDEVGVALLHFVDDCGYLIITRRGVLHMIRRIDTGRHELIAAAEDDLVLQGLIAGIALETQRSLDYYESHYDCRPITEVVLGPGAGLDSLPAALAEQLGLTVSRLDFSDLFRMEHELTPEEQGHCLLAVGAALRPMRQEHAQALAS